MKTRIITATVLLALLAFMLYFYNYKMAVATIIIISAVIKVEWELLMKNKVFINNSSGQLQDLSQNKKFSLIISIVMFLCNTFILFFILDFCTKKFDGGSILMITGLLGIFWLINALIALYKPIYSLGNFNKQILYRLLPNLTTISVVFSCIIVLNHIWIGNFSLLLFVFPLVWITDSLAYFIGRKFGKRKLAKNISPKKTIEGAIGGMLSATSIICFAYYAVSHKFSMAIFIYFFSLSFISVIGDLFQSRLKREFDIKDSSQLLPGHGGFFDRFDAAIPVILFSIYFPDYDLISNIVKPITGWI
jgi:phosphatidate cytidylyltransferase